VRPGRPGTPGSGAMKANACAAGGICALGLLLLCCQSAGREFPSDAASHGGAVRGCRRMLDRRAFALCYFPRLSAVEAKRARLTCLLDPLSTRVHGLPRRLPVIQRPP